MESGINQQIIQSYIHCEIPDDEDLLNIFTKNGTNINHMDDKNKTALHYFTLLGRENMVKSLVENNADTNIQDINGKTAVHYAAHLGTFKQFSHIRILFFRFIPFKTYF